MEGMARHAARAPGEAQSTRGTSYYVGLVMILAGLGVLGYVGWQLYGTNYVSRQAQDDTVTELRQEWSGGGSTGSASRSGSGEQARVRLGEASALVRIPRFGDDYVIPVLEGIGSVVLATGYGHFPDSADPGARGNYALAAHRITHGEPLRDMPELRPGDEVIIETRDMVFTYELDTNPNNLVVTFEDVWVVDPLPDNPLEGGVEPTQEPGQRLITLTTCAELFHTDDRLIAFGHLVDTAPKSPGAGS